MSAAPSKEDVVQLLGQIFANMTLYGPDHNVTKQSLDTAFNALSQHLETVGFLDFALAEGKFLVDGRPMASKNRFVLTFAKRLADLGIGGFTISKGVERPEFETVVQLLSTDPKKVNEGLNIVQMLMDGKLPYIQTRKMSYQLVAEDEVVVHKSKRDKKATGEGGATLEEIMAFFKGDLTSDPEKVSGEVKELASHPEQFAEMILQAVNAQVGGGQAGGQAGGQPAGGVAVGDLLASNLRRTFEVLGRDPEVKTPKGKKNIKKTVLLLEKNLLDRLAASGGEQNAATAQALEATAEEIADELDIEALAAEYMRKRLAIEANEKRILRYLKGKGEEAGTSELKDRLLQEGMSAVDWNKILFRSGAVRRKGGAEAAGGSSIAALALMLTQLEQASRAKPGAPPTEAPREQMDQLVRQVGVEVSALAAKTEQKIQELDKAIRETGAALETAGPEGVKRRQMSRQALLATLAEIVEELCQPLSVIICTTETILGGYLGGVTDGQKDMLTLAETSGRRVRDLTDKLVAIVGLPTAPISSDKGT